MNWRTRAACQGVDTDIFFPERGADLHAARAYCSVCPVASDCLEWALNDQYAYDVGVYGGTSARQRRRIRNARRLPAAA